MVAKCEANPDKSFPDVRQCAMERGGQNNSHISLELARPHAKRLPQSGDTPIIFVITSPTSTSGQRGSSDIFPSSHGEWTVGSDEGGNRR